IGPGAEHHPAVECAMHFNRNNQPGVPLRHPLADERDHRRAFHRLDRLSIDDSSMFLQPKYERVAATAFPTLRTGAILGAVPKKDCHPGGAQTGAKSPLEDVDDPGLILEVIDRRLHELQFVETSAGRFK